MHIKNTDFFKLREAHLPIEYQDLLEKSERCPYQVGVTMPDCDRIWRCPVDSPIGWNSLQLFWLDRFNPTARLSRHYKVPLIFYIYKNHQENIASPKCLWLGFHWCAFQWVRLPRHSFTRIKEWCAVSAHHSLTQPCSPKTLNGKPALGSIQTGGISVNLTA